MDILDTTNGRLARVRSDLADLIGWADADAEASNEADAKEQRRQDRWRGKRLRKALAALTDCER